VIVELSAIILDVSAFPNVDCYGCNVLLLFDLCLLTTVFFLIKCVCLNFCCLFKALEQDTEVLGPFVLASMQGSC